MNLTVRMIFSQMYKLGSFFPIFKTNFHIEFDSCGDFSEGINESCIFLPISTQ